MRIQYENISKQMEDQEYVQRVEIHTLLQKTFGRMVRDKERKVNWSHFRVGFRFQMRSKACD